MTHYQDKVYGGWMGKNIGGTLGGPLEGRTELMNYDFYPNLANLPLANDDLDLQLVWLHALETYGPRLSAQELAQEWLDHVFFPYDEYGYGLTNMRRGLRPPVSGWYSNPFSHCMGSPIRSEIWAMVAPGRPEIAAYYAYQDAITDHAGGEGIYGEMFFAAIESAAFIESDRDRLIQTGLRVIPAECRTARAVQDTLTWHAQGLSWVETRQRIIEKHGHINFTDAPQNIAFTMLGWLYGTDFGDALCKAVNCGYDTDCTGATLGAILGIIMGARQLPTTWTEPVGNAIVVSPPVKGFPAPKHIEELSLRTAHVSQELLAFWEHRPRPDLATLWQQNPQQNRFYLPSGSHLNPSLEVIVHYDADGPVIFPGQSRNLELELINHASIRWYGDVQFQLPSGWVGGEAQPYSIEPGSRRQLVTSFLAGPEQHPHFHVGLHITRQHNGSLWQSFHQDLVYVQGMRWHLENPQHEKQIVVCPTNRVSFDQAWIELPNGVYRASTRMVCPSPRDARLIIGTAAPVRVYLNGKIQLDSWQPGSGIPAYHRGRGMSLHLHEGTYDLTVELEKQADRTPDLYIALVADRHAAEPGAFFSFLDVMFV